MMILRFLSLITNKVAIVKHSSMRAKFCLMTAITWGLIAPKTVLADAVNYDLTYHVQWGDSQLGTATAKWTFDETSYAFDGQVATEGTLAFFYEFEGKNTLTGKISDNQFKPQSFMSESVYDDETYVINMSWPDGLQRPIFDVEPEPEKDKVHPLRRATLRGVVDPYTAMLNAMADLEKTGACNGTYRVFDGRRRSDLLVKDFGTTTLVADEDWAYQGPAHVCGTASKLIGGHRLDSDFDPKEEPDFEKVQVYIAKPDGKTLMPVRIEMNGFLGSVTVRLNMDKSNLR